MAGVSAEIKGLQEVQRKMEQMVRDMGGRGPLFKTMSDVLLKLERDVKRIMSKEWHDTGRSMASVTPKIVTRTNEIEGVVGSNVVYVPYGEFGTEPHTIVARHAKALAFEWEKGPQGPGMYFFKRVRHPGIKARRFFRRAFESNENYIRRAFDQVVKLIVER